MLCFKRMKPHHHQGQQQRNQVCLSFTTLITDICSMKAVLLYNLYPKTNWKAVTEKLLSHVPHDNIIVHVAMPWYAWVLQPGIKKFLSCFPKISIVIFSANIKGQGESVGFSKLKKLPLNDYDIITYVHSKGTSKKSKHTGQIKDWTELMRYFVIERLDLCKDAFAKGYWLYGANLSRSISDEVKKKCPGARFHYSGNFVSMNNRTLGEKFISTECSKSYYGVEFFWGTLCEPGKAFCVHESNVDHYHDFYPPEKYLPLSTSV